LLDITNELGTLKKYFNHAAHPEQQGQENQEMKAAGPGKSRNENNRNGNFKIIEMKLWFLISREFKIK